MRWGSVALIVGVVALYLAATRPVPPPEGWSGDFRAALALATATNRSVLVAFHMNHCTPCVAMDRTVLRTDDVKKVLEHFVPLLVDVDRQRGLANRYGVFATPTYAVLNSRGALLAQCQGFQPVDEFVRFLRQASTLSSSVTESSGQPIPDAP